MLLRVAGRGERGDGKQAEAGQKRKQAGAECGRHGESFHFYMGHNMSCVPWAVKTLPYRRWAGWGPCGAIRGI
ncbi:hypothetical protein GLI01_05080 [Gluconacetobacter liquefaciens]|nr:hypothetical protein GLI01_05080 [Gluconacetobacter liquefaciens]